MKIVISAPSGTGKSTIIQEILKRSKLKLSKSYTTRQKRTESDNEYFFLSEAEFLRKKSDNFFFETEFLFNNHYGIPKHYLDEHDIIFNIDIKGFFKLKEYFTNNLVSIFILPPSLNELENRLKKRGENDLNLRLQKSINEIKFYSDYKYCIINDDLEQTINLILSIISLEHEVSLAKKIAQNILT